MNWPEMKAFAAENPVTAAVVALGAVVLSPVVALAAWPLLVSALSVLAPVLVPAVLFAVVSVWEACNCLYPFPKLCCALCTGHGRGD